MTTVIALHVPARARDPWQELADDMVTGQPVTADQASPEAWELFEAWLAEPAEDPGTEYDPDATPERRFGRSTDHVS